MTLQEEKRYKSIIKKLMKENKVLREYWFPTRPFTVPEVDPGTGDDLALVKRMFPKSVRSMPKTIKLAKLYEKRGYKLEFHAFSGVIKFDDLRIGYSAREHYSNDVDESIVEAHFYIRSGRDYNPDDHYLGGYLFNSDTFYSEYRKHRFLDTN